MDRSLLLVSETWYDVQHVIDLRKIPSARRRHVEGPLPFRFLCELLNISQLYAHLPQHTAAVILLSFLGNHSLSSLVQSTSLWVSKTVGAGNKEWWWTDVTNFIVFPVLAWIAEWRTFGLLSELIMLWAVVVDSCHCITVCTMHHPIREAHAVTQPGKHHSLVWRTYNKARPNECTLTLSEIDRLSLQVAAVRRGSTESARMGWWSVRVDHEMVISRRCMPHEQICFIHFWHFVFKQ